jgi:hypothetical protein
MGPETTWYGGGHAVPQSLPQQATKVGSHAYVQSSALMQRSQFPQNMSQWNPDK